MDKKLIFSHAAAFVIGCVFTGTICFSWLGPARQQLRQVRAERERAAEQYRELESTVEQLSNVKSEYDRLYCDIGKSVGRLQDITGNNIEIIRSCREIISEIRDSMQSFEDNTGNIGSCHDGNGSDNNVQTAGVNK